MSLEAAIDVSTPVPVIDLRHEYANLVAHHHFNDYVREHAAALVSSDQLADGIDVSCLIIVDDAASLPAHSAAFASVLGATAVKKVVCVAIGMADPERRTAVVLPSVLNRESVAVLWAGDPAGIAWRIDQGPASVVRVVAQEQDGDPRPLADLLEALRTREVFQRVVREAQTVHTPVTAPAVRVRSSRLDDSLLAGMERRALTAVATSGEPAPAGGPGGRDFRADVESLERGFQQSPHAAPGGRVRSSREAAKSAVAEVTAAVTAAGRWWSVGAPLAGRNVGRLSEAAGTAVSGYGAVLAGLFRKLDNRTDDQRRSDLQAEGIELPPLPPAQTAVVDDVSKVVQRCLEKRRGLDQTVKLLHGWAAGLLPLGSAARVPAVERATANLRPPPPLPRGFGGAAVVALAVLAPLLAALGQPPARYAGLLALLVTVVGAVAVRAKRHHFGPGPAGPLRDAVTVLVVALAGGAGFLAGTQLGEAGVPAASAAGPVFAAAGLLLAVATPILWWQLLIRRWKREFAATATLRTALDELDRLYAETTAEWVVTDVRRRASDTTRATAGALDAVRATLTARAQRLLPEASGVPYPRAPEPAPAGAGAATAAMRHDLVALVQLCLADRWPEARDGDLHGMAERAAHHCAALLDEYERHLRRHGVEEPPPGWPAQRDSEQLNWWDNGVRGAVFGAGQPVQLLCGDDQVHMLSRDLKRAVTIRFAPRRAQLMLADREAPGQEDLGRLDLSGLVWTTTGTAAGVVHLVPLKVGVRHVQTETSAARDDEPPPGNGW